jgi:hypothetical protein
VSLDAGDDQGVREMTRMIPFEIMGGDVLHLDTAFLLMMLQAFGLPGDDNTSTRANVLQPFPFRSPSSNQNGNGPNRHLKDGAFRS